MKSLTPSTVCRLALLPLLGALVVGLAWPLAGSAQDKPADPGTHKHAAKPADTDKDLAAQVRDLQAKIARLEAALQQSHKSTSAGTADKSGMADMPMGTMGGQEMGQGMKGMAGMEGMDRDQMMGQMMQNMGQMMQMMGQMQGKGMSGMGGMGMSGQMSPEEHAKHHAGSGQTGPTSFAPSGPPAGVMGAKGMGMDMQEMMGGKGMQMMGGMKGMSGMSMPSALPGFPGASHIYHIGATGFFLDHPEHIKLTTKQQTDLNGLKEKALLEKSTFQRKMDEAEQELWMLTASDKPDGTKIDAKVHEIEKVRGDQRLAFIRAVGEAAKVLTDEQRQALLGNANPQTHQHTAPPSK
jgi:hypothetical protein